jgi:hypothetical protein
MRETMKMYTILKVIRIENKQTRLSSKLVKKKITHATCGEKKVNDQMINRSLLSHMEKLLIAHVERLLWSRRGSNPVLFGL